MAAGLFAWRMAACNATLLSVAIAAEGRLRATMVLERSSRSVRPGVRRAGRQRAPGA
jgi:hypothetical protein